MNTSYEDESKDLNTEVGDLLDEFLLAQESGYAVSPEELCKGDCSLLRALQEAIDSHRQFESLKDNILSPVPHVYGAYDVRGVLDTGGCGTVFLCRHRHLQRDAAVKVVVLSESNALAKAHFAREIEVVRQFGHDRIVTIFDSGIIDRGAVSVGWLAMEYLSGGRIDTYVAETNASKMQILLLFRSVVATLLDAQRSGILHHDIKPGNILISKDGKPHVADFGLASISGNRSPEQASPIGTPRYMAPELMEGQCCPDVRSEIYSLGVLLRTLMAGTPNTKDSAPQTSAGSGLPPQNDLSGGQSRDLDAVLRRMTAAVPLSRYSSLAQLLSEIDGIIDGRGVEARPASIAERGGRWIRRSPTMAVLGAVAGGAIVIAFSLLAVNLAARFRHAEEIDVKNKELIARERQLQRSAVSSRLRSTQALLGHNRTLAKQELEDESLFPRSLRGFAWKFLRAEVTDVVNDLSDLGGGFGGIYQVKFSPDDRKLVVCSKPKILSIIDISQRTRKILPVEIRLVGTVLSHTVQDNFFCQTLDGNLLEVEWSTAAVKRSIPLPVKVSARMALTSTCDRVFGLTQEGRPFQLELASETIRFGTDQIDGVPAGFWLTPDNQELHCVTRKGFWHSWDADSLAPSNVVRVFDMVPLYADGRHSSKITVRAAQASYDMQFGLCMVLGFNNGLSIVIWPDSDHSNSVLARSSLLTSHFAFRPRSQCVIPDAKGGLLFSVFDSNDQEAIGLVTDKVIAAAVSTDNQWVSTGGSNGKLFVRRISSALDRARQLTTFSGEDLGFGAPVRTVQLRPSGETLVCHREGWCAVINANTNQLLESFKVSGSQFSTVAYSPENRLVVLGFGNPTSRIVGLKVLDDGRFCTSDSLTDQSSESPAESHQSPEPAFDIQFDANVTSMCFAKNGEIILVALRNGSLITVDVATERVMMQLNQFDESSAVLSMSAVEEGILCGAADGRIHLFSPGDGTVRSSWRAGNSRTYSLITTNDESQVIAGMASGKIRVFDRHGTLIRQLTGHQGRVLSLALSADGETLASGAADHRIAIWDAFTGEMQLLLRRHTDTVTDLHFARDDAELWSTAADGAIHVWHTRNRSDDIPPKRILDGSTP